MSNHQYDESKIKTLSSLEHIRKRPGMYIGRLGDGSHPDDGIYILLKEVVDNAIDEFIMGYGKRIEIKRDDLTVSIRDYGRGIPLGKVIECVSQINTGAKYNDDVFQFSVGLNGVGNKAVNALSDEFTVKSWRKGRAVEALRDVGSGPTELVDLGRQRVEVGRLDGRVAGEAEVAVSGVVTEDDHDVRRPGGVGLGRRL